MRGLAIVAAAALAAACTGGPYPTRPSATTAFVVAHRPPTAKDVIDAVLASATVELAVSPTCDNVGTEPTDRTLGRYLAGFMAEMAREDTTNWIETEVAQGVAADGQPIWVCKLTLRHRDPVDRWGWGVMFHVRQRDGAVLDTSFTCTGAG